MTTAFAPEDKLVQYLLGRMSEPERVELEARLFEDEDLDAQLLAVTDDLIHAYLAGTLSEEDRARFEAHFLASPENREQVASMGDLLEAVDRVRRSTPAPRSQPWALAAAAVVLLAVTLVLVVAARRTAREDRRATASPRPTPSATVSAGPRAESPLAPSSQPPAVHVVRLAGKSSTPVRVGLPPSTRIVRVEVAVGQESPSYDATMLAAGGKAVWRTEGRAAPASGKPLVLEMPAEVFASGRYTLRVEGEALREAVPPVLEYPLEVVRAPAPPTASPR